MLIDMLLSIIARRGVLKGFVAGCLLGSVAPADVLAAPWNMPLAIDDSRASIRFSISTDSGKIRGQARDISGKAWLADSKDSSSIRSSIEIPMRSLEVDDSRLQHMKTVLLLAGVDSVQLSIKRLAGRCKPELVPCGGVVEGTVGIQNSEHFLSVPVSITRRGASYLVVGTMSFRPSDIAPTLIRTLAENFARQLTVSYELTL